MAGAAGLPFPISTLFYSVVMLLEEDPDPDPKEGLLNLVQERIQGEFID